MASRPVGAARSAGWPLAVLIRTFYDPHFAAVVWARTLCRTSFVMTIQDVFMPMCTLCQGQRHRRPPHQPYPAGPTAGIMQNFGSVALARASASFISLAKTILRRFPVPRGEQGGASGFRVGPPNILWSKKSKSGKRGRLRVSE